MAVKQRPQCPRKLLPDQVRRIRQMAREGFAQRFLAKTFGISRNSLKMILNYSTYKDIR